MQQMNIRVSGGGAGVAVAGVGGDDAGRTAREVGRVLEALGGVVLHDLFGGGGVGGGGEPRLQLLSELFGVVGVPGPSVRGAPDVRAQRRLGRGGGVGHGGCRGEERAFQRKEGRNY